MSQAKWEIKWALVEMGSRRDSDDNVDDDHLMIILLHERVRVLNAARKQDKQPDSKEIEILLTKLPSKQ